MSHAHTLTRTAAQKDHFDVQQYLKHLDPEHLRQLGLALGLLYPTLKKMREESFLDDLIHSWLIRQDSVIERSGEPSYGSLGNALEQIGQVGLARDVREQKYTKINAS